MTIPSTVLLPDVPTDDSNESILKYLNDFKTKYESIYEEIVQGVNGDITADFESGSSKWLPVLDGAGVTGTFTYTHQYGWALRQGLMVDVWGDVQWSGAGTAAGNLFVTLPYQVALTNGIPFVGVVQSSVLTFTGGTEMVINGISDTFRGEFWNTGDAFTTANQAVVAAGRLIFHIRYMGQAIER